MINLIKKHLSQKIDKQIVEELVNSYEKVRREHLKNNPENVLIYAGKFVERLFILLEFLNSNTILKEIRDMKAIKDSLEKNSVLPEPIKLLIPRIASSLIWDTRSKMGAAHVKAINPDFIDSELVVSACNWIMSELLRNYYTRDVEEVNKIIKNITKKDIPLIQRFDKDILITKKLGCGYEILLLLYDSDPVGLTREQLGKSIHGYTPGRITQCIDKLEEERFLLKLSSNTIRISDAGVAHLFEKIK